jgi:hypothetical protein
MAMFNSYVSHYQRVYLQLSLFRQSHVIPIRSGKNTFCGGFRVGLQRVNLAPPLLHQPGICLNQV